MVSDRPMSIRVPSRADVFDLLSLPECFDAVESALRLHAEGRTLGQGAAPLKAMLGGSVLRAFPRPSV